MPRRFRALPAVLAAATLLTATAAMATAAAAPASATPAAAPAAAPAPARAVLAQDPLEISIDELSPSVIPARGQITIRGQVTNLSRETWTDLKVYPFISADPMVTEAELTEAAASELRAEVGGRLLTEGAYTTIPNLAPGQSASYQIRLRRSVISQEIGASDSGVYWFGTHVLGANGEGGDAFADGRARTFLPLVPSRTAKSVKTALVVPIRRPISYDAEGKLTDIQGWKKNFAAGGRLRQIIDLAATGQDFPVSWLVDPALLDAAQRLVDGNPGRDLTPNLPPPGEEPSETEEPTPSDGAEDGSDEESSKALIDAGIAAEAFLAKATEVLKEGDVLALPYGDVDVAAAAGRGPELLREARRQAAESFEAREIDAQPAVAPVTGFLTAGGITAQDPATRILVSDEMLRAADRNGEPPTTLQASGHNVVLADSATGSGGPGPESRSSALAMRQRILAEAAMRVLSDSIQPLVVSMPAHWRPGPTWSSFFAGLDVPWLSLETLSNAAGTAPTTISASRLIYPDNQAARELRTNTFESARALTRAGRTLDRVLPRNDLVSGEVTRQALTGLGYGARADTAKAREATDLATEWIADRLGEIEVEAPPSVTMSSESGKFSANLVNRLDQPVTVRIEALTDSPNTLTIDGPQSIELDAGAQRTVLLNARSSKVGIHEVTLVVTDVEGDRLGSSDDVPLRAGQLGKTIWMILAAGGVLLFGAIAIRLVRRFRNYRRTSANQVATPASSAPTYSMVGGGTQQAAPPAAPQNAASGTHQDAPDGSGSGSEQRSILSSSAVMAAGTIVSRMSGFVRSALLVAAIGNALHAELFTISQTVPTMLYILLAGGIFNAVLVPQLVRAMKNDPDGGEAYTNRIVTLAGMFLLVVTVVLVAIAPWLMQLFLSPNFSEPALAAHQQSVIDFARLVLPQVFFYGMFVLVGQILNARGVFGPMMWAPIANNVITVVVLSIYLLTFGAATKSETLAAYTQNQELLLGLGFTLGIVTQFLILMPYLKKAGFTYRPRFDFRDAGLGKTLKLGLWTVLFVIVNQISYTIVVRLASGGPASSPEGTGYAVYSQTFLLTMVPHAIITVSLATAILPRLSQYAADHDLSGLGDTLSGTLRSTLALILPFAAVLPFLAEDIAHLQWGFGAGADGYHRFVPSLALFGIGLTFFTVHYLMLRGFYALERNKTAFWIQCVIATVNIVAALTYVRYATDEENAPALVLAYATAYLVGCVVSYLLLRRTLGGLQTPTLVRFAGRMVLAVGVATAAAGGAAWLLHTLQGDPPVVVAGLNAVAIGVVDGVVFLAMAKALGIREVTAVIDLIVRRLPMRSRG